MDLVTCFASHNSLLMEGALGTRLRSEYHLSYDEEVAMASFVYQEEGREALRTLWRQYIEIAGKYGLPFLATTPTRRANREHVERAGFGDGILRDNVRLLQEVRQETGCELYIGGLMGCKGNAYTGECALTEREAREFHRWQAQGLCRAGVSFLFAGIMPTLPEAAGMAWAMAETGLPYIISFTVQSSGRIIDGTTIHEAIGYIDKTVERQPLCYMANCVHPNILYEALSQPYNRTERVRSRFCGIQANMSPLPYEMLDRAKELFGSPPDLFARDVLRLKRDMGLKIIGGCCGTDQRHMEAVAKQLV